MLASRLRAGTAHALRAPLRRQQFRRTYNGVPQDIPHTTYFQQPPPKPRRRWLRTIVFGTTCFTLGVGFVVYGLSSVLDVNAEFLSEEEAAETNRDFLLAGTQETAARETPNLSPEDATDLLASRSAFSATPKAVGHTCQSPSNFPCEDTWSSGVFTFFNDPARDWYEWAIFDGHAGPRTSQLLKRFAPSVVGEALWRADCMSLPYVPNDPRIVDAIKKAFLQVDSEIVDEAGRLITEGTAPRAEIVALSAAAFSGSCALLALFDPARSILRIANVGDSRAVLGRWDADARRYVAQPLSVDQTGFNSDEVARNAREHPDEKVIDPRTGRVHGLAVTRAFGDARWKWTEELSRMAHDKFWGPNPRPKGLIKTPPYLTAEPEVTEIKIRSDKVHPDFLIMASDGLWDMMSSEDAVTCVQMWLDKNKPDAFLQGNVATGTSLTDLLTRTKSGGTGFGLPAKPATPDGSEDEDLYLDESDSLTKWRVGPKHFTVEDDHCGMHLIRNALGGKRKELFASVMSVQPPLSRNIRDDITVHVIFFGIDAASRLENWNPQ